MAITQLAEYFANSRPGKCHNAEIQVTPTGALYILHGNTIAERIGPDLRLDWCNWFTSTTARHMNAILKATDRDYRVSYTTAREASCTS